MTGMVADILPPNKTPVKGTNPQINLVTDPSGLLLGTFNKLEEEEE